MNVSGEKRRARLRQARSWTPRNPLPLIMVALLVFSPPVLAAPQGGTVVSGSAAITQVDTTTNIDQSTNKAIINWQGFGIAANETVNFNQPSASAVTLNRVIGNEASVIDGALNANGQVFLVNSAGVLMGQGASVNTAGFVAGTLNISNEDFNAGNYTFQGDSAAEVINLGTITAQDGGYVALLGKSVSNQGVIVANLGTVALAGGERITLNFNGDSIVNVTIDQGTLDALIENKEAIYADGGTVILTAKAADELLSAQVNNDGLIQARTIGDLTGAITLLADGGTTTVDGTLDASAPSSGNGGFIETSGKRVTVVDSAMITTLAAQGTTGNWLINPDGFVIGEGGDMSAATLATTLGRSNVSIESSNASSNVPVDPTKGSGNNGNIDVNDAVSWAADTILNLTATNDININAPITASGENAGLSMTYGGDYTIRTKASYSGTTTDAEGNLVAQEDTSGGIYGSITLSGNNASLTLNGQDYTLIHSMDELAALDDATGTATGYFAIAEDLDAAQWSTANDGADSVIAILSGTLTGLGHTISNLTLNASSSSAYNVGLIAQTKKATWDILRDLGLININLSGPWRVGALTGKFYKGTISNVYVTGNSSVSGRSSVGGLLGYARDLETTNTFSDAEITAELGDCGGLIGNAYNATVSNSHASGAVTGGTATSSEWTTRNTGGLIGNAYKNTTVSDSYATGDVVTSYTKHVGGLIGYAYTGSGTQSITNSFATGDIIGVNYVGGLIGYAKASTTITVDNCYATGDVTGTYEGGSEGGKIGGLIGSAERTDISNAYATGNVNGTDTSHLRSVGGLVGSMKYGSVDNSYATGNVYGNDGVGGLVGANGYGTISNSYATGNVSSETFAGGLVGCNNGSVSDSWASGDVSGFGGLGGLAGINGNNGSISGSAAYGDVTGIDVNGKESKQIGGLAGMNSGSISDSTAAGNVSGGNRVGALVGYNYDAGESTGTIDDSSATGTVTANDGSEGLTGLDEGVTTNSTYTDVAAVAQANFEWAAGNQAQSTLGQALQNDETGSFEEQALQTENAEDHNAAMLIADNITYVDNSRYSSNIKNIEVDGVRYDLEKDDEKATN